MLTLGPKFGISDVALRKRCVSQGVPTPPPGYWARVAAGKPTNKPPLPTSWTAPPKKLVAKSSDQIRVLPVPCGEFAIDKPLPSVKATAKKLQRRADSNGLVCAYGEGTLRTQVSPLQVERALYLWQELLSKFVQAGLVVDRTEGSVSDGTETVSLQLEEMLTKYEVSVQPGDVPPVRHPSWVPTKQTKWLPNGVLRFSSEHVDDAGCAHQWKESPLRRMEERIDDVVAGIVVLLRRKREVAKEKEERRKRREEEARLRAEQEERRKHEVARKRRLVRLANSCEQARVVRSFCHEVLARSSSDEVQEFTEWALAYATRIDPVHQVLKDIEEGRDPVEPEWEDRYPSANRQSWL